MTIYERIVFFFNEIAFFNRLIDVTHYFFKIISNHHSITKTRNDTFLIFVYQILWNSNSNILKYIISFTKWFVDANNLFLFIKNNKLNQSIEINLIFILTLIKE